ncbi:UNVERIFIED_CONTAM: hypothetical protein GTU68_046664 [Idotea baltica]|nr:hypothetical protein [Idotea baltica]
MDDSNFQRSVILICEHRFEGSFGLILNKQLDLSIGDAVNELSHLNAPLFFGGPVQPDTLHFIHSYGELLTDSLEISKGVFWGGDFEHLKFLAETNQIDPQKIRFYLGYSGWSEGQLTEELKEKSWITSKCSPKDLFSSNPLDLWQNVLGKMGGNYRVMSHFPVDPTLN